jgi:glycosyltransferase involved in cell wall biosynthesis
MTLRPRILACYTLPAAADPHFSSVSGIPGWDRSSLLRRVWILLRLSRRFEACIFNRNQKHLILAMAILSKLRLFRSRICVEDLFFDHPIIRNDGSARLFLNRVFDVKYYLLRTFIASVDVFCVHTRREAEVLGKVFCLRARTKIVFVPTYVDVATLDIAQTLGSSNAQPERPYALIAGTLRDYRTAIQAFRILKSDSKSLEDLDLVIVCHEWDPETMGLDHGRPTWLHIFVNVPWREYLRLLKHSLFSIVPLYSDRPLRSLGHTQFLESLVLSKPVICAGTFHLDDYVTSDTALIYSAGCPESLSDRIRELCEGRELYLRLAKHGFELAHDSYNPHQYLTRLANAIRDDRE